MPFSIDILKKYAEIRRNTQAKTPLSIRRNTQKYAEIPKQGETPKQKHPYQTPQAKTPSGIGKRQKTFPKCARSVSSNLGYSLSKRN